MSIANCSFCRISFNAGVCPDCGRPANFDEKFEIDEDARAEKHAADVAAQEAREAEEKKAREEREAARIAQQRHERTRPMDSRELDSVIENLRWARCYLGEHAGADELRDVVNKALTLAARMSRDASRESMIRKGLL